MLVRTTLSLISLVLVACGGGQGHNADIDAPAVDGTSTPSDATSDTGGSARDPALDGDQTVTTAPATIPGTTAGRTLMATVFTPSGAGSHALVIASPGFQ